MHMAQQATTHCLQCGTCCRKGGPALHRQDLAIVRGGHIGYSQLVAIRKGEFVVFPLSGRPEPAGQEMVKLAGRGRDWECCLFDPEKSNCTIYEHRPLECRLLKCWDTQELVDVIGRDVVGRRDLLNPDDPIVPFIERHDLECPAEEIAELVAALGRGSEENKALARLTDLVRRDLAIRSQAEREFGLSVALELFVFGRPLFSQLAFWGITLREEGGELYLAVGGMTP